MIQTIQVQEGITLRCCTDTRFKTGCLTVQLVRPITVSEAAMNALLPAVLLRGSARYPDLRSITLRLDDLYGTTVGAQVRKIGDYQTTGLFCGFIDDRYTAEGEDFFASVIDFLRELLLHPLTEDGGFCKEFVESEKKNLLSAIEAQRNDKRIYAAEQLMKYMGKADTLGISRMGEPEKVAAITPQELYAHYERILKESRMELFYVGSCQPETVCRLLTPLFQNIQRCYVNLPAQTPFCDGGKTRNIQQMEVTQAKLQMGFLTDASMEDQDFAPMQVLNTVLGGMTGKLFMNIREKQSLCYDIGSVYQGCKGVLAVSAGMDCADVEKVEQSILQELEDCCRGNITPEELESAKQTLYSSLRTVHDSPGGIENYYGTSALSGLSLSIEEYMRQVQETTVEQLSALAKRLQLHSVFILKGVQ